MTQDTEKLKREIEGLEQQISSHPFEGLFDRKRLDQLQDRLKKKRKELARLVATGEPHDTDEGAEHAELPEFVAGVETMPDMGPRFPVDMDIDEHPELPKATRSNLAAKSTSKTAMKSKPAISKKPKKKIAAKPRPKPKPKPKPKAKQKAKPAKKSKR